MPAKSGDLPPLEFIVRSKQGISFYSMNDGEKEPHKKAFFESSCCEGVTWSSDGSLCVYRETTGVRVFDMKTNSQRFALELPKVVAVSVSPLNSWLVTLVPFKSEPNLQIWDMKTGALHFSLVQKSFARHAWPYLQWDSQEDHAMFHHGDVITLYNGHDLLDASSQQVIESGDLGLSLPFSVTTSSLVSLSPSTKCPAIVVFTAVKDEGRIAYFADKTRTPGSHFSLQANLRVLNCNQATCEWNRDGDRAVITVSSDVDQTGTSYYGRTFLYYLFNDFKLRPDFILNILRSEQSVQESHFSCDGTQLCAITASVPAATTLFSAKECKEEGSCGKLNANTVLWSPHNQLLLLGGFGNLSGDITIWDNKERKRIVQFKTEYITSCAWLPNSRYLVMGTCYPRMKIDNRLYLYKFNGVKLYEESFDLLYEIAVRPIPAGILPIRPPTKDDMAEVQTVTVKKAPAKYVPPHLRGKGGAASGGQGGAGKPKQNVKKAETRPRNLPPVHTPPKQGVNVLEDIFASISPKPQEAKENESIESLSKRLRNLEKKLRDIEQLKTKFAILNEEQRVKIGKEESIRREVEEIKEKIVKLQG